jgi:hypothetical protein
MCDVVFRIISYLFQYLRISKEILCVCLFEQWKTFKARPTEEQIEIAKYDGCQKVVLLTRTNVKSAAESVTDTLATLGWWLGT